MKNQLNMGCFRYFLIPYEQISIFQSEIKSKKSLMESLLLNNETSPKVSKNDNEEKYKLYLISKLNNDNYILHFGKQSTITQIEDTGNDFEGRKLDNHPYIVIYINTKEQIILFEKKTVTFRNFKASSNAFSRYINKKVEDYGYEFKLEEIQSSNRFWNIIESSKSIESISLLLYSPNLFDGHTPAEKSVKELEAATNSTENILTFKNKHGKLRLIKEKIATFIEYISCGGGNWLIKAHVPNQNKTKFSSKDNTKVVLFPKFDNKDINNNELLAEITVIVGRLNKRPGDDKNHDKENDKGNSKDIKE